MEEYWHYRETRLQGKGAFDYLLHSHSWVLRGFFILLHGSSLCGADY